MAISSEYSIGRTQAVHLFDLTDISIRCLNYKEMEDFVERGPDSTAVASFNPFYPGIDAVAHLNLQPIGGEPFQMTAFINVNISSSQGSESLEHLKHLISKAKYSSGFFLDIRQRLQSQHLLARYNCSIFSIFQYCSQSQRSKTLQYY